MRQLLIVRSSSWEDTQGTLYCLEELPRGWNLVFPPINVSLGKNGMAWGKGLHEAQDSGPIKKEGDLKSPAGIFPLIAAFGYDLERNTLLPYILIDDELECVDDPHSRYYNQFVNANQTDKDWNSSEKMLQNDDIYERGIVVAHNMDPPVPGAGSCIFIHKWRSPGAPTAGCTGLSKKHLEKLISWLDLEMGPLLIQLPEHLIKQIVPWLQI